LRVCGCTNNLRTRMPDCVGVALLVSSSSLSPQQTSIAAFFGLRALGIIS
jgi:hypothetical protein